MRNYFTLAGRDSRDFGLYINGEGTFDGPSRSINFIEVPGRDGDLISTNTRLMRRSFTYPACFIFRDFETNFSALKAYLTSSSGYRRLVDTYHPDEYLMVAFQGPIEPTMAPRFGAGQFDLTFDAQPQRWLISGETTTTLTATGTITNPTLFAAKPLLRVTTTRAAASVLGVGATNITIKRQGVIYIDCATGRAYNGATPLDSYVTLSTNDYPTLAPGSNGISLGTGISRVEITPRWWRV